MPRPAPITSSAFTEWLSEMYTAWDGWLVGSPKRGARQLTFWEFINLYLMLRQVEADERGNP